MNKVWKSPIALSMNTERNCEFILALPLKTVHSQNGPRCVSVAPAVCGLTTECCDKIFHCGSRKEL